MHFFRSFESRWKVMVKSVCKISTNMFVVLTAVRETCVGFSLLTRDVYKSYLSRVYLKSKWKFQSEVIRRRFFFPDYRANKIHNIII